MKDWVNKAIELLEKSLQPPQELNEIDWKSGLSDKNKKLAQHLSAFANYPNGGYLAYGIADDGTSKPLDESEINKTVETLGNIARNNLTPPVALEHEVIDFKGNRILFIRIPEHVDKPVHLQDGDLSESYTRSAAQTVKLGRHEIKQLIANSTGFSFEEQTAIANAPDNEVVSLIDYDSYFTLQEKQLPDTKSGILQALENEDLIKKSSLGWDILNLGAILFARNLSFFKQLKRKSVRVIHYENTSRINALKEQEGTKGYASGFEGLIDYIMDQLPANEVIENTLRKTVKVYPTVVIREFVANALIHQDFMVTGAGVMVEIFRDRIEITNPGAPLVDVNRFIDTPPQSRNETLASLMRRLNICEERGSGIDRAINAIEMYQLPAPNFIRGDGYTTVILYAPRELTKMNTEDRIRACYQHTCLNYVNQEAVNNQSIRKRFKIAKNNSSFASKIISETLEAGFIKPSDPKNISKKFSSYSPFWA